MRPLGNPALEMDTNSPRVQALRRNQQAVDFPFLGKEEHLPPMFRYYRRHFNAEDRFDIYLSKMDPKVKHIKLAGRIVENLLSIGLVVSWCVWAEAKCRDSGFTRESVMNRSAGARSMFPWKTFVQELFLEILEANL